MTTIINPDPKAHDEVLTAIRALGARLQTIQVEERAIKKQLAQARTELRDALRSGKPKARKKPASGKKATDAKAEKKSGQRRGLPAKGDAPEVVVG